METLKHDTTFHGIDQELTIMGENMNFKKGPWLDKYIKEIYENRTKGKNQQLFEAINNAVGKVLEDPTSKEFSKHTIDPYKAVDVLPQVRLFFVIENDYDLVFFVWVNDLKEFPHDSSRGDRDKCYKEFKRLKETGKLDQYIHEEKPEPQFNFFGKFRNTESIHANLTIESEFASSQIELNQIDGNEYILEHISESDVDSNALIVLIEKICEKAIESNINLNCVIEKYRGIEFINSIKNALIQNNFKVVEDNTELIELEFLTKS